MFKIPYRGVPVGTIKRHVAGRGNADKHAIITAVRALGFDPIAIDALYAAPHQSKLPERWESSPFDGHWTASVLASQDPVAVESVAVDFSAAERTAKLMEGTVDNYLHEAALAIPERQHQRVQTRGLGRPQRRSLHPALEQAEGRVAALRALLLQDGEGVDRGRRGKERLPPVVVELGLDAPALGTRPAEGPQPRPHQKRRVPVVLGELGAQLTVIGPVLEKAPEQGLGLGVVGRPAREAYGTQQFKSSIRLRGTLGTRASKEVIEEQLDQ